MPHYKLYYFDVRARGELIRVILTYAGVEFEDFRFSYEDWLSVYKKQMIFGQAPVLEVGGQQLAQSFSICRYLARQFKIAGQNPFEEAQADMYIDALADVMNAYFPSFREKDPVKKRDMDDKFLETVARPYLERLDKHLSVKNGGYLVGDSLTWADIGHWDFFEFLTGKFGDFNTYAPHFKALTERVGKIPAIEQYAAKRAPFEI